MSDLAYWLVGVLVYSAVVSTLLVIALGGNRHLAKRNRWLSAQLSTARLAIGHVTRSGRA